MGFDQQTDGNALLPAPQLNVTDVPPGIDRRAYMMRSAVETSEGGLAVSVVLC